MGSIDEILKKLDEAEYYKIIGDETELKWFYDNCVPKPLQNEAFAFCLSSRHKKLTEEERKGTGLGRSEMLDPNIVFPDSEGKLSYSRWKKAIRKYECNKEAFTTKEGKPFPSKTLVCYYYINPTNELGVIKDIKKYINIHEQELVDSAIKTDLRAKTLDNIMKDVLKDEAFTPEIKEKILKLSLKADESGVRQSMYKLCKSLTKMKHLQFDNCGTKYWVDFDMDLADESKKYDILSAWKLYLNDKIGKENYIVIETGGGFHTLVKKQCIKFNPNDLINKFCTSASTFKVKEETTFCGIPIEKTTGKFVQIVDNQLYYSWGAFIDELIYNTNAMCPCPGTYQYGNIVKIHNKENYVPEHDMIKEE